VLQVKVKNNTADSCQRQENGACDQSKIKIYVHPTHPATQFPLQVRFQFARGVEVSLSVERKASKKLVVNAHRIALTD
jgi:hypothetical protein